MQIIDLICEHLTSHDDDVSQHKLVLTVSVEIIKHHGMKPTQEEADNMIVLQVAELKAKEMLVVVDTLISLVVCCTYVAKVAF